jgi:hypothetical protein
MGVVALSRCSAGDFQLFATGDESRKECAADSCKDLSGADFRPCKRLLGAGVVAGQCKEIGGCDDSKGHTLFEDIESCRKACPIESCWRGPSAIPLGPCSGLRAGAQLSCLGVSSALPAEVERRVDFGDPESAMNAVFVGQ